MKILALGDVVGSAGCEAVRNVLPQLRAKHNIDFCVANGENSAEGNGILPGSATHLFDSGVDVITTGNHVFKRKEIYPFFDACKAITRPANYSEAAAGVGSVVYDMGSVKIGVFNLSGVVYMPSANNPFWAAEQCVNELKNEGCKIIVADIHAEATAEKKALGFFLDGKAAAVFGTHTHVQTSDEQIFENGTGYITDVGMCGPFYSVLGIRPENAIEKMRTNMPVRFETAPGQCIVNGAVFDVDKDSGKCVGIERICEYY